MNEELQKAITELFNSALTAKDFLVGELPDYINQLLMWRAVYNGFWFVLGVAFCVAWGYANYIHIKWLKGGGFKKLEKSGDVGALSMHLIQIFLFIPAFAMINLEWLQIWIAPKVWLAEYAASLVK